MSTSRSRSWSGRRIREAQGTSEQVRCEHIVAENQHGRLLWRHKLHGMSEFGAAHCVQPSSVAILNRVTRARPRLPKKNGSFCPKTVTVPPATDHRAEIQNGLSDQALAGCRRQCDDRSQSSKQACLPPTIAKMYEMSVRKAMIYSTLAVERISVSRTSVSCGNTLAARRMRRARSSRKMRSTRTAPAPAPLDVSGVKMRSAMSTCSDKLLLVSVFHLSILTSRPLYSAADRGSCSI